MKNDMVAPHLVRNLRDAGCTASTMAKFLELHGTGRAREQMRLLKSHRAALLKKIHNNQKRIDCLDFLIYTLTQKAK